MLNYRLAIAVIDSVSKRALRLAESAHEVVGMLNRALKVAPS